MLELVCDDMFGIDLTACALRLIAGVAAARVNSLFHAARQKAPCIIFIDEIDAIGRSRSTLGGDPGSMERESALLSLLVQMDGIHGSLEQVRLGRDSLSSEGIEVITCQELNSSIDADLR